MGAGRGRLVTALQRAGYEARGIDPSARSASVSPETIEAHSDEGLDAVVMWPDQPRQSYRYRRLVLPFKRRDGSSVLLGTTLHDPDIDLRIKRNQELLQVLQ